MGYLHIYCGSGKGKTTAALGLALRAAGAGRRVYFFQLLKGAYTSELASLGLIPDITVVRCEKNYGFVKNMTEEQKHEITLIHNEMLTSAKKLKNDETADMLVLDELCAAYRHGLLDKKLAEELVTDKRTHCEIVITGRNPPDIFIEYADYISEIRCIRHPYEKGIPARKGIEY